MPQVFNRRILTTDGRLAYARFAVGSSLGVCGESSARVHGFPDGDTLGRVDNQIPQWRFVGSCKNNSVHRAMNADITRPEQFLIEVFCFCKVEPCTT